jgi:predicted dehydrogenase
MKKALKTSFIAVRSPVELTRRKFLARAVATAASPLLLTPGLTANLTPPDAEPPEFQRKLKLGLVGCGSRGSWIAKLFLNHGGYQFHAVADYFPEVARRCGQSLGVDSKRCYSTLSGYQRVLESGIEAVVLEVPPLFFPEQAQAAVRAGLHVYMAKPVAVDVPGCLQIEKAARQATGNHRCFLVDYQMPTDPANLEVYRRLRAPGFGKIARLSTVGICGGFDDPPFTANLESRLQRLVWVNDIALGCDYIGNYDIHAIDAALWVAGQRPLAASGSMRICRPDPHGDSHDVSAVVFEYADGLVHDHAGLGLKSYEGNQLSCRVHGQSGNALLSYLGKATFRSYDDNFSGDVQNLYEAGVKRNIGTFYQNVTQDRFGNETVRRAVDGALACVLGRVAAVRHSRLTMDKVLQENEQLQINLHGLKS